MAARTCNGTADGPASARLYTTTAGALLFLASILSGPAADAAALAYVTNCSTNTVSSYDVDSATGQLRRVEDAAGGKCPLSVTVHPSGKFVYVQHAGSDQLSVYAVDAASGALTLVTAIPAGKGRSPGGAIVHPSGNFLYLANFDSDTISIYSLDPRTGVPRPTRNSPFATGNRPGSLAIDPAGRFLYTTNFYARSISGYRIDPTTGALAAVPGSPFPAGDNPKAVAVAPSGRLVYVANFGTHDISTYRINTASGTLQELLPRISAGTQPGSLVVYRNFVYVANMRTHDISTYRLDPATGALRELRPRVKTIGWPEAIALFPSRRAIYATSYYDEDVLISAFTINGATGALTPGRPAWQGRLNRQSFYAGIALSAAPAAPGALRVAFGVPQAAAAPLQVELILDASNSMWGQSPSGRKIDLAKKALASVIKDLPPASRVALRVYGNRQPRELKDCEDSTLLVPLGPLNKARLIEQVQTIRPRGMTPLAYSLKQVFNDLGSAPGEKLVILVSDGNETCGGDPVAAVKTLHQQGVDIRLEVVGLAIADAATKRRLDAIAALTRGSYHAAKNAPELKAAITDALRLDFTVEDQRGFGVARGMVGSGPLCLQPGNYRISVRGPKQTYTFNNVAIAPGQQTHLTLTPQGTETLNEASQTETLTQPCSVGATPSSFAQEAHTPR